MGKEWLLYWVSGNGGTSKSAKKRKSVGGRSSTERESAGSPPAGCMCSVFQLFDLHHFQFPLNHHHHHHHHHHQTTLKTDHSFLHFQDHELSSVTKGVEAPRNSLELLSSAAAVIKEEEILNIPVGIQIRTSCDNRSPRASTSSSKARGEDVFSECGSSNSPGAKTPNLVARLMGLDLLPETTGSPSLRRSSITNPRHGLKQLEHLAVAAGGGGGSVSLPETPRISLARRSDVEQSRLSLQMNREYVGEELESSGKKKPGRRVVITQDENRIPGARNIIQQVKERVSNRSRSRNSNRKVGLDITNTLKNREQRRDDNLILQKPPKKTSPLVYLTTGTEDQDSININININSKQTTPSCSPRIRSLLDPKNKSIKNSSNTSSSPSPSPRLSAENQSNKVGEESNIVLPQKVIIRPDHHPHADADDNQQQQQHMYNYNKSVQKKFKKAGNERFHSLLIRNKKEEPFVLSPAANKLEFAVSTVTEKKKKCKKKTTPLSNEILPVTVTVTRKDSYLLPLTKLRDKQKQQVSDALPCTTTTTRLPSCSSRSYTYCSEENIRHKHMHNGAASSSSSSSVDEMEFQYLKRILKRTGLDNATPVTLANWFSPTHPLDPSIFHYMELFHHPPAAVTKVSRLSLRSNRKLMFQLVDEILVEILKPYINPNPNPNPFRRGQQRVLYGSEVMEEVCRRMKKFPSANCQVLEDIDALIEEDLRKSKTTSYEEEEDEVGERIALEIMEALVHETSSTLLS